MTVSVEPRPRRRRLILLCSLGLAAAAVLVGVWFLYQRIYAQIDPPAVETAGVDPAVVRALEEKREAARRLRTGRAWGELGMTFLTHGFGNQAIPCLRQAEKLEPDEPRWPYLQGVALRPEKAVGKLQRAVQLCDNSPDAPRLFLGELLLELNRPQEAADQFAKVLDKDPANARAHLGLARLAQQRGDLDESLRHLSYAENDEHTRKAAQLLLAQVHEARQEGDAAAEASRKAQQLAKDAPWPDPFYEEMEGFKVGLKGGLSRARKLLRQLHVADAVKVLEETTRQYPDSTTALVLLGQAYSLQDNLTAAETTLDEALQLAPDSTEALFRLGVVLVRQNRTAVAAAKFRQAVALKPDFANAYYNLGKCLLKEGDRPAAMAAFRSAAQAEPQFGAAHVALGAELDKSGRHAEAIAEFQTALKLDPDDREARHLLEVAQNEKQKSN